MKSLQKYSIAAGVVGIMLKVNDKNRKWWILIAMSAVAGLIMLDETVIGIALPTMRRDLGMSQVVSHWVINAYMLVFAVTAAAAGRMGDIVGFKTLLIFGVMVFGLASLASGFSGNSAFLISARSVQGVGAAVIFPCTIAMITTVFPKKQRGKAIGIMVAIGTTLLAAGPLIGGFFTEILSWRWIFWINIPIVVMIALIISIVWIDPPRESTHPTFDYGGLLTLVTGLSMLVFAIMQGATWGWSQGIILALLVGGIAVLTLFVLIEHRCDAPLIEVGLFRNAMFSACNVVLFVGQFSKITIVVFGALYLQNKLGMRPIVAGLALLASVAPFPIMSAPAGRIADKFGARWPVLGGLTLATLAMFWISYVSRCNSYHLLLPGLVFWGAGMVFCYSPTLRAMANAVPTEKQGQTSGIGVTSRLLGSTIGMSICSTLLTMTESFQVVFLVTGSLMFAALLLGWITIERQSSVKTP